MKNRILLFTALSLVGAGFLFYRFFDWEESFQSSHTSKSTRNLHSQILKGAFENADDSNTKRVAILYTGNTQSDLEPCGCYVGQSGGIARRGTLIDNIRKEGIVPLILDAGGILDGKTLLDRLRGETNLKAMKIIGYDAINMSSEDFRFGWNFLSEVGKKESLPFVSTNLLLPPTAMLEVPPYLLKEVSGIRIAVLGVSQPNGDKSKWQEPASVLKRTVFEVKNGADIIILLSSLPPNENRRLAAELKAIDVVISSHKEEAETKDRPLVVYSSPRGKYLGRVDLKIKVEGTGETEKGAKIVGYEVSYLSLPERIPDHPKVRALLTQFYESVASFYESVASNPELQKSIARLFADQAHEQDPRNGYVGAKSCESCHQKEYNQWQTTEHAFAYNTLLETKRYFYPECVLCHTTGFGSETGFHIGQTNDSLANVQCETCHGPGRKHIAQPEKTNIRKAVQMELCAQCHSKEHSPNFLARAKQMIPSIDHSRRLKKAAELIAQRVGVQNKVKVELFVMSQCPYGTAAEKEILPTIQEYRGRVDFHLYHIAREIGTGATPQERRPFTSLHGTEEIEEGIRQVVIAKYYPTQYLDYLLYRTKNFQDAKAWIDCARQVGIDVEKVSQIANSAEGEALFRENIQRGRLVGIETSPTFLIDGQRYTNELFEKSSCYQKSDVVPVRYHLKNFPIQSILGASGPKDIPAAEYASLVATLEQIRQKLNLEATNVSQLQQLMSFQEEAKTLQALSQKYPSNLAIGMLLAEIYREQGLPKPAAQQYKNLGFFLNNEWRVVGPFDTNRWASGFRKRYPPEKEINLTAIYDGQGRRKVSWMKPSYETVSAYVDLKPVLKSDVCASYALAIIEAPREMNVQIRFAVYGMAKLWVNEEQVFSKKEWPPRFQIDGDVATAKLWKGKNRILLKVVAQGIQNGFILRMTDFKGQPLPNLKVVQPLSDV